LCLPLPQNLHELDPTIEAYSSEEVFHERQAYCEGLRARSCRTEFKCRRAFRLQSLSYILVSTVCLIFLLGWEKQREADNAIAMQEACKESRALAVVEHETLESDSGYVIS
jgi:hypothetical protein